MTAILAAAKRVYEACFQNRDAPCTGAQWETLSPETQRAYVCMAEAALGPLEAEGAAAIRSVLALETAVRALLAEEDRMFIQGTKHLFWREFDALRKAVDG